MAAVTIVTVATEIASILGQVSRRNRKWIVEVPMMTRGLNWCARGMAVVLLTGFVLVTTVSRAEEKEKKAKDLELDKIPKAVMDALKAKFPKAEIHKWTKEKEGDDVVYDIEFKQEGRKCEADIKENGTYINYEREIAAKDLPDAVKQAVEKKYPKSTLKEVMEIMAVKDKKEALEGFEIILTTAAKQEVEVTVAPDGKILEDTGVKKDEKK